MLSLELKMDPSHPVNQRFLELATNKDITDEELSAELTYLYARWNVQTNLINHPYNSISNYIKYTRETDPNLISTNVNGLCSEFNKYKFNSIDYEIEKYEMKQRIRSLEQSLAAFMEQTKAERMAQEAVIQSLSKEVDEFQEEFYDCRADVQEQKDVLQETVGYVEKLETEIHTLKGRIPFVKDKMA